MGRGPKATISLTYCIARAELKVGGGPRSAVAVEASAAAGLAGASAVAGEAAATSFCLEHATRLRKHIKPIILMTFIVPFSPPALSAALDAPGKQFRCSPGRARPWAR